MIATAARTSLGAEAIACACLLGVIFGPLVVIQWDKIRAGWRDITRPIK